jgi:hypothetical protein
MRNQRVGLNRSLMLASAVALCAAAPLTGQSPLALPGEQLRLEVAGTGRVHGELVRVTPQSVILIDGAGMERVVARADLRRVWVTRSSGHAVGRGVAGGAAIGFGAGAIVGAVTWEPCRGGGFMACFLTPSSALEQGALVGILVAVPGAIIGGGIGALTRRRIWTPAELGIPEITAVPQPGGGLRLALTLRH